MAWLAHAALCVLLLASFASGIRWLRIGIMAAALIGIFDAVVTRNQPGLAFGLALVIVANLMQLAKYYVSEGRVHFTANEDAMRDKHFATLSRIDARRLIDQGHWIAGKRGEVLIREDQAAPSLFYIAEGSAEVLRDGIAVGHCTGGDLVGEATVLDGDTATGTVRLVTNANLWFVPAQTLRAYLAVHGDVASALHQSFSKALRGKLAAANAQAAGAG